MAQNTISKGFFSQQTNPSAVTHMTYNSQLENCFSFVFFSTVGLDSEAAATSILMINKMLEDVEPHQHVPNKCLIHLSCSLGKTQTHTGTSGTVSDLTGRLSYSQIRKFM